VANLIGLSQLCQITMTSFDLNRLQHETSLQHVEYHETLDSTNKLAAELLPNLMPLCPAIVLATTQTAGRGRGSNSWWANSGALTFSLILNVDQLNLRPDRLPLVSLATGVAVRQCIAPLVPDGVVSIKWPNDVLLNERKVAGILTEQISVAGLPALIIGVGVNVNNSLQGAPDDVQQRATSVFDVTGGSIDLTELLISILNAIDQSINELGGRSRMLLSELNRHSVLNGRTVKLQAGETLTTGLCHGIDEGGALVLLTDVGPTSMIAGTVLEW
jgi:BirA family transcriptional regulator, biotin operon repressor / biotin---[acetyl-CoA-carboxylase] ligase